jgi:hypothetical protein
MCVSCFSTSVLNIFHSDKYLANYMRVTLELRAKTPSTFHAKHPLLVYDFSNYSNGSANFNKTPQYKFSRISVSG